MSAEMIVIAHGVKSPTIVVQENIVAGVAQVLETSSAIGKVESVQTCEAAALVWNSVDRFYSQIEKARKAAKAPVLALGKEIDAAVEGMLSELKSERERVGNLIENYKAEQRRLAEIAKREEEDRLRAQQAAELRGGVTSFDEAAKLAKPTEAVTPAMPASTGTSSRKIPMVVIDDLEKVPIKIGDVRVLFPNEPVILELLRRGTPVPGCHLEERNITVRARS